MIRMDRIGDLILTLPVDQALAPGSRVKWWIPKSLGFIAQAAVPKRDAREVSRKINLREFFRLLDEVRRERFDAAVVFHAPWWVSMLLWLARVPERAGVKSQWHSFLFLNRGVRQKRSQAEHSELEYAFRLMEEAFATRFERHTLSLQSNDADVLAANGLVPRHYSVVHPGMGGSALNWPTERYAELIRKLSERESVVITGTASDNAYLAPLREAVPSNQQVRWLDGKLSGPQLIAVLAGARSITAPSTGVLHLAASTGRPTLGIFSPVRVQQPRRWGPQGPRVKTLMPAVDCPGEMRCLGRECAKFDCMRSIQTVDVLEALASLSGEFGTTNEGSNGRP